MEIVEITGRVPRRGSSTPAAVFEALRTVPVENKLAHRGNKTATHLQGL